MIKNNNAWFTLIELVIVILILSFLMWLSTIFLSIIKNNNSYFNEKDQVYKIQDTLNSLTNNWYDLNFSDEEKLEKDFQPEINTESNVYYKIPYLTPVLLWNWEVLHSFSEIKWKEIKLWIQTCEFIFNYYWNSISWKPYLNKCWKVSEMSNNYNLQWYILWDGLPLWIERSNFNYNNIWIPGYTYNIYTSSWEVIYNESWLKNTTKYKIFDLLLDKTESFFDAQIFIFILKDNYIWNIWWIYYWNINELWINIKNKFIINHLNNASTNFSLLKDDLGTIFNYKNIQFFYNEFEEWEPKKANLINLWLNF